VLVVEFRVFTERLYRLAKNDADAVLRAIQGDLLDNPARGTIVPGLAGIRKARAENPGRGKGKRGGFRYMYYFLERDDEIYLLFLFDKGEQEDLNEKQKAALRGAIAELKGS
jgi:mRNA-degrading endonuclease RelE of RelBE toxin-antitoxin system